MKKNLTIIYVVLFFVACSDNNSVITQYYGSGKVKSEWYAKKELRIKYYENGKIECKEKFLNGKKNGKALYFNKDGNIEELVFWENGILNGINKKFYPDGRIKEEGLFENGKTVGWCSYYSETSKLMVRRQYVIVKNASHLNQVIYFDSNGDTIDNRSMYFKITAPDTISYVDSFSFFIEINPVMQKGEIQFHTGEYNKMFQLKDSSSIQVWGDIDFKTAAYVYPKKRGKNVVRGVIINYDLVKSYENYVELNYFAK